jgi:hypothetical protein
MRQIFSKLLPPPEMRLSYAVLATLLSFLYLSLYVFQARVDFTLELDTPQATFFKIYWAEQDQGFSETRMSYAAINAPRGDYHLRITSLNHIERIRIDPIEYSGTITLENMRILQFGFAPIRLQSIEDFSTGQTNAQIKLLDSELSSEIRMQTNGRDGNLELDLSPQRYWTFPAYEILTLGTLLIVLAIMMRWSAPLLRDWRFVPLLLVIGFSLALLMALTTGLNLHPDEVVHLSAVNYYAQHLLPPPLDSPDAASTFSIYGHSRLSGYEIFYQLAGYFQSLLAHLDVAPLLGARTFSLIIFAAIIATSFRRKYFRPFLLPLLVSAQVWYLYSYTNSDAFALSLVIIVSYLVAYPDSALNHFLSEDQPSRYGLKLMSLGILLGALLLLKINYYFYILFLLLYLIWRLAQGHFPDRKRLWRRLSLLALVALSLYGARFAMDIHANGWDSTIIQQQMQEKYARAEFKSATPLEAKNSMLLLRDRGRSLGYIVVNARWFEKSFESAFGVYGFADYVASKIYYDLLRAIALALLVALFIAVLRSKSPANIALLLIIALSAGGLVAMSIWLSWTIAFQPQGRYLLPILPMLGILYYHTRLYSPPGLVEWLSLMLFILAAYSFVYTGLNNMGFAAVPLWNGA